MPLVVAREIRVRSQKWNKQSLQCLDWISSIETLWVCVVCPPQPRPDVQCEAIYTQKAKVPWMQVSSARCTVENREIIPSLGELFQHVHFAKDFSFFFSLFSTPYLLFPFHFFLCFFSYALSVFLHFIRHPPLLPPFLCVFVVSFYSSPLPLLFSKSLTGTADQLLCSSCSVTAEHWSV